MWFTPEQIWTNALEKLKRRNNNKLECKLIEVLYEAFYESELEEIKGIPQDFLNMIKKNYSNVNYVPNDIRKILKNNWGLEPQKNGLIYNKLDLDYSGRFTGVKSTGRYYTIKRKNIDQKFVEFVESVE